MLSTDPCMLFFDFLQCRNFFFNGNELRYENRSSVIFNSKIIFLLFLYLNFPVTCISKVLYTTQIVKAAPKGSCHENPYHLVFHVSSGCFFKMHQYNEPCLHDFSFLKLLPLLPSFSTAVTTDESLKECVNEMWCAVNVCKWAVCPWLCSSWHTWQWIN